MQIKKSYNTLASNLEEFHEMGKLPATIRFSYFDEGNGIADTLASQKAKWHKSCFLDLASSKLKRAEQLEISDVTMEDDVKTPHVSDGRMTRSLVPPLNPFENICCLCRRGATWKQPLHQIWSRNVENELRTFAAPDVLTALGQNDCISQEVKYHKNCLNNKILNKQRKLNTAEKSPSDHTIFCESMAFSYLVQFIECKIKADQDFIFKMSTLTIMYEARLHQLVDNDESAPQKHTTRLRLRIEAVFPQLISMKVGREYQLIQNKINFVNYADNENTDHVISYSGRT